MLPEFAGKIAEPLGSIDKISVVDSGNGDGAARVSSYVTNLMAQSGEMLKNVAGVDLHELIRNIAGQVGTTDSSKEVRAVTQPVKQAEKEGSDRSDTEA